MSDDRLVYVSEEEAARLWQRAAELQVDESRKVEERSRVLRPPVGAPGGITGEHLTLDEVLQAAREVGIGESHLDRAVAELREERATGTPPTPDVIERVAAAFFGHPPSVLEATAELSADPATVYEILQSLLPDEPYNLRLRGVLGVDPLVDGVLIFDAPRTDQKPSTYALRMLMAEGRVIRLYVTLRANGERGSSTRVTLRGRIGADPEPAFWMGSVLTTSASGAGAVTGGIIGGGVGLGGALLAGPVVLGALLAAGVTYSSVRARYLHPLVRGIDAMEELLEVLAAAVKTRGAFLRGTGRSLEAGATGADNGWRETPAGS